MSARTQERGKENPSAHPRTHPLNPRYKSRAVEYDGTRMLFVAVRKNLSMIVVDAGLLTEVARRLQSEGKAMLPGKLGFSPGRSRSRRASTAEDHDLLISYLNPLSRSMFLCLIGSWEGFFGLFQLIGLVFTVGRSDPPSPHSVFSWVSSPSIDGPCF